MPQCWLDGTKYIVKLAKSKNSRLGGWDNLSWQQSQNGNQYHTIKETDFREKPDTT